MLEFCSVVHFLKAVIYANLLIIQIENLKEVAQNQSSDSYVADFEDVLVEIHDLHDADSIPLLIDLSEDDCEYDELMFSIIHTIEDFNDEVYAKKVLEKLEDFYRDAPRWTSIVHMRILNSSPTLAAYINELKVSANKRQVEVLRTMLEEIGARGADLKAKTTPLLDVVRR